MESPPFLSGVPDQSLIIPEYFPETDYVVATGGDGYAFKNYPTGSFNFQKFLNGK
jgi:hypothetical protein